MLELLLEFVLVNLSYPGPDASPSPSPAPSPSPPAEEALPFKIICKLIFRAKATMMVFNGAAG